MRKTLTGILAAATLAVTLTPTTASAMSTRPFDCRIDGDDSCIVRIVNGEERADLAYLYHFVNGRPTWDIRLHPKQFIEDDRYIVETGPRGPEGAWDCRWDGDDKCVGRLGGVRYVFPFADGSPEMPYVSAWQG